MTAPAAHAAPAAATDEERLARVAWSMLAEPDDQAAHELCTMLGAPMALACVRTGDPAILRRRLHEAAGGEGALEASTPAMRKRWEDALLRWSTRLATLEPDEALDLARARGIRVLVPGDPEWPIGLEDLDRLAPHCLWVHGPGSAAALCGSQAVAMVGSRAATVYGEDTAASLAAQLASQGGTIVSGGAYGIDAAAHRGALASTGGATLAVLAGGLDRLYPRGNTRMLELIRERHLLVSEAPPGTAPTRWRFLSRNRLIAALSRATVVVEASWRSGALSTARWAGELGRPVGAVPGPITSAASAGCHRLVREQNAVLVTEAQEVRELMPGGDPAGDASFAEQDELDLLTPSDRRILDAVPPLSTTTAEAVARETGSSERDVAGAIARMELLGVLEVDGERVRRPRAARR